MLLPDFDRVLSTLTQVRNPLSRWLHAGEVQSLEERLHAKAQAMRPRIMVYGLYNAGKSTLINAMTGRAQAPMGDCPTTLAIIPYAWRGYTLLDTPGIDAPVHHEAQARAEIERSDVVLFVVAMGGAVDEAKTWQELVEIVRRGRRVMLIVNNRQGLSPDSQEFLSITDTLRTHLQTAGHTAGLGDILKEVPIYLVNARSALKGCLENKPALLEHSGIVALQQELTAFLRKSDKHAVLHVCRSDVLRAVDSAEMALQCHAGDAKSQALTQVRQRVEHERTRLTYALNECLDQLLPDAKRQLAQRIEHAAQAGEGPEAQAQLEAAANTIASAVGTRLNAVVAQEVAKTLRQLRDVVDVDERSANTLSSAETPCMTAHSGGSAPQRNQILGTLPTYALLKQGSRMAMTFGTEQLPKLFKGVGSGNLGRWAGLASKWLGVAVQVVAMFWQFNDERKERQRQQREWERQAQSMEDAASAFARDLRASYQGLIAELVEQVFQPLLQWLSTHDQAANMHRQMQKDDLLAFAQARIALRLED